MASRIHLETRDGLVYEGDYVDENRTAVWLMDDRRGLVSLQRGHIATMRVVSDR